jgi:hypothetical protein
VLVDLTCECACIMVTHQPTQRGLVQSFQDIGKSGCILKPRGERRTVNLSQRTNEGITVLPADLTICIAVPIV